MAKGPELEVVIPARAARPFFLWAGCGVLWLVAGLVLAVGKGAGSSSAALMLAFTGCALALAQLTRKATVVVDRGAGVLRCRFPRPLQRFYAPLQKVEHPLAGLTAVRTEPKDGRTTLLLVYGERTVPLTPYAWYGAAALEAAAKRLEQAVRGP
ncbi:MAG: hypothetical protein K1X89_13705 [Myxococcaceae bacterium]|nr:hypothetical protein [Myxococcaceae bacterium]